MSHDVWRKLYKVYMDSATKARKKGKTDVANIQLNNAKKCLEADNAKKCLEVVKNGNKNGNN